MCLVKNARAQNLLYDHAKLLAIDGGHILRLFRDIEEPSLGGMNLSLSLSSTGNDLFPDGKSNVPCKLDCQVEFNVAQGFPDPSS